MWGKLHGYSGKLGTSDGKSTKKQRWHLIGAIVSWVLRAVAIAFWGYALYAVFLGKVRIASRSTDMSIEFASAPLPFIVVVCFDVAAGAFFMWIAKRTTEP